MDSEPVRHALSETGQPPELADQLIAIAQQHGVALPQIVWWIHNHPDRQDWTAATFAHWCRKYRDLARALAQTAPEWIDNPNPTPGQHAIFAICPRCQQAPARWLNRVWICTENCPPSGTSDK